MIKIFLLVLVVNMIGANINNNGCDSRNVNNKRCDSRDEILIPWEIISDIYQKSNNLLDQKWIESNKGKIILDEDLFARIDTKVLIFTNGNNNHIIGYQGTGDGSQTVLIFSKNEIPKELLERYEGLYFHYTIGGILIKNEKETIEKKIQYAYELDSKYFTTKKGARLGMSSAEAIKIYGPPDSIEVIKKKPKTVRYKWEIYGGWEVKNMGEIEGGKIPKGKICENLDFGADYIIDFRQMKNKDEAIFIFIDHHIP